MNICLYNTIQYMPKSSTVLPLERKEDLNVLSYTLIFGTIFYYCNTLLSYFFSRRLYRTACAVWEHFRKSSADIFFAADHNVCITSRLLWTGISLMELLLSDAYYFMSCDERKKFGFCDWPTLVVLTEWDRECIATALETTGSAKGKYKLSG